MPRPTKPLSATKEQKEKLEMMSRRRKTSQQLALRSRIVLECLKGSSNTEVAEFLDVCKPTVGKWRERFRVFGLEGLTDEPRPGAPRSVTDLLVEEVITRTLESKPKGATQWSTRSMAASSGLSQSTISRIWRAFSLKPHRQDTFKLSTDPFFVEKVRDIVGLYLNPPEKAVVLSVDEKSQIQALDRTQPLLPLTFGHPEKRTHDYVRHGTTSLFAALNVKSGQVMGKCYRRHRHQEFLKFLKTIEMNMPKGKEIHLIVDNYATHKTPRIRNWLGRRPHWKIHFTPTSASWLNQVELFFSKLTTQQLRRGVHRSVKQLEKAIYEYLEFQNSNPKPFVWTATAEEIFQKVEKFCKRTSDSPH